MTDATKEVRIAFRVEDALRERFEAAARREGRTLSDWARRALYTASAPPRPAKKNRKKD